MIKHAILVITHDNEFITSNVIKLYDDYNIDFYILVDKKSDFNFQMFENINKRSKVYFIKKHKVCWGNYSQIAAELLLLKEATKKRYDYYHLISGCDLPLFSKDEFLNFFIENNGVEFVDFVDEKKIPATSFCSRVEFFHFFVKYERSEFKTIAFFSSLLHKLTIKVQKVFHISRINKSDVEFKFGSNWFDITHDFALEIIKNEIWIKKTFSFSFCGDELFVQTIMYNSDFLNNNYCNKIASSVLKKPRYVDWKRGSPYVFKNTDLDELLEIKTAFFVRKFNCKTDDEVVSKLIEFLSLS